MTIPASIANRLSIPVIGSPLFIMLFLAELGLVFYLSARVEKIQAATASGLFIGYSVLIERVAELVRPRLVTFFNALIAELVRVRRPKHGRIRPGKPHREHGSVVQQSVTLDQMGGRCPESAAGDGRNAVGGGREFFECPEIGVDELRFQQEVLGRVTGDS